MKQQLLVLLFTVTAFFATAQTTKTDLVIQNLKGKVKSVNATEYEAEEKFGKIEKGAKTDRYYWEFNKAGMELHYMEENFDDEKDKLVRATRYENDKAIEVKEDNNGEVLISKAQYNQQGLIESIDALDSKGNLLNRKKNKYNAEGLLIQADIYNGDGSLDVKTVSSYNSKKQRVKEEWYNKNGKFTDLNTYVYNSRGNMVEESSVSYGGKDQKPYVQRYVYNDKDQKIEERNSISGLDKKEIYEYNAQGDEVRKLDRYDSEEKKVYTYDGQNNWIKCVTTSQSYGNTTHKITERQIRYY